MNIAADAVPRSPSHQFCLASVRRVLRLPLPQSYLRVLCALCGNSLVFRRLTVFKLLLFVIGHSEHRIEFLWVDSIGEEFDMPIGERNIRPREMMT